MATNLNIDDKLLNQALKLGKFKTKKETVNKVLEEYVNFKKRQGIIELFGKVDYDPNYDYKKLRKMRRSF